MNTALLAFKLAKLANLLDEMLDAKRFVYQAEELFLVVYGPKHPFVLTTVNELKTEIEMLSMQQKAEEKEERMAIANNPSG